GALQRFRWRGRLAILSLVAQSGLHKHLKLRIDMSAVGGECQRVDSRQGCDAASLDDFQRASLPATVKVVVQAEDDVGGGCLWIQDRVAWLRLAGHNSECAQRAEGRANVVEELARLGWIAVSVMQAANTVNHQHLRLDLMRHA